MDNQPDVSLCQNGRQSMQSIPVQVELIFERGFFSGMNVVVVIVLFLAQSLSLPIPQMRCIIAASNNRNSLTPLPYSHHIAACRQALVRSLARSLEAKLARQVKLDNERAANINFLLLAKLGLPAQRQRRRVRLSFWVWSLSVPIGIPKNSTLLVQAGVTLCVRSGVYCCQS